MHENPATAAFPETLEASPLRHWLMDHVCRFWADRLVDPRGGFHEALDAHGLALKAERRTILVQGRLTYVFSHAAVLDASGRMREFADHGFHELARWEHACRLVGGWARARRIDGGIDDAARDTYDQCFVILACGWYYAATKNAAAIDMAERAYGFLCDHVRDQAHGGFFEEFPSIEKLPRRQNPHMHLLEACLAMYSATRLPCWLERCELLVSLFVGQLFDRESGTVAEFYGVDWTLAAGTAGDLREPGHQFEWIWLLCEYRRLGGVQETEHGVQKLFDFGMRHGIDRQEPRVVMDGVDRQGAITAGTKLFWPQTEYIKACVVRAEAGDLNAASEIDTHFLKLKKHFFRNDGANWCNQISREGAFLTAVTPARVLYHLFLAVAEMIRYKERLAAGPGRTAHARAVQR